LKKKISIVLAKHHKACQFRITSLSLISLNSFMLEQQNTTDTSGMIENPQFKAFVAHLKKRNWAQTFRPMNSFVGTDQFSKPRTTQEASTRLELNLNFFLTNYLALCAIIGVFAILSRPLLIFVGVVLGAGWYYVLNHEPLMLPNGVAMRGQQKLSLAGIVTAVVVFFTAGATIFMIVGLCSSVVVAHAVLHNVPSEQELDAAVEMEPMV